MPATVGKDSFQFSVFVIGIGQFESVRAELDGLIDGTQAGWQSLAH